MTIHWEALAWTVFAGLTVWFVVLPLVVLLMTFLTLIEDAETEENDEAP
jgi:hypothetical protein